MISSGSEFQTIHDDSQDSMALSSQLSEINSQFSNFDPNLDSINHAGGNNNNNNNPSILTNNTTNSFNDGTSTQLVNRIQDSELLQSAAIQKVLNSDVAINALLFKFKQSLLTCEEFIKFLRKKYMFEDEHTQELLKHYRNFFQASNGVSSLKKTFHDILQFDGKLGQVKQSYVKALQKMYDEISSLLLTMTKVRKSIKENSKRLEKEVMDSIHNAEKAQSRYNSLCQDYEKLRMEDPTKTKLTLRGSKTTREQEEELLRKIDIADQDYRSKVDHANSLRDNFLHRERPQIVAELKNLILEMDTAMAIQLQKYTIYTENLILNSGVTITPFNKLEQSMKSIASSVRNERDLYMMLNKYNSGNKNTLLINKNLIPINYKIHPSMERRAAAKKKSAPKFAVDPSRNSIPKRQISTHNDSPFTNASISPTAFVRPVASNKNQSLPDSESFSTAMSHVSTPLTPSTSSPSLALNNKPSNSYNNINSHKKNNNNEGNSGGTNTSDTIGSNTTKDNNPPRFPSLDPGKKEYRLSSIPATLASLNTDDSDRPLSHVQTISSLPPGIQNNFKTFNVPLENLIEFEQDMVPAIVSQCIYVVDKYGLDLEGIYRRSANVLDVSKLKEEIDTDPSNISMILPPKDYIDADIYLVGSLLKTFFASLPDTLLPHSISNELKTCFAIDDYTTKKNFMHGLLYKLPDAQYWTLRSLLFHLKRVLAHEEHNRMNLKALCIIWGPTIIPPNDDDINDVNYQIALMEVLINVADQAFEPE